MTAHRKEWGNMVTCSSLQRRPHPGLGDSLFLQLENEPKGLSRQGRTAELGFEGI